MTVRSILTAPVPLSNYNLNSQPMSMQASVTSNPALSDSGANSFGGFTQNPLQPNPPFECNQQLPHIPMFPGDGPDQYYKQLHNVHTMRNSFNLPPDKPGRVRSCGIHLAQLDRKPMPTKQIRRKVVVLQLRRFI